MIKRFAVFFAVNMLVVLAISILMQVLGIRPYLRAGGLDIGSLAAFCLIWGMAGSFISLQLSRWTAKRAMGVELIDPARPGGALQSHLVETVQSLCRRAELDALPEIGIYPSPEVNAFATGPSRSRALLAVSTGLLEQMDDKAVRGVLGHELAHIANGDMVTMTLIQGVVNAFVMFASRVVAFAIDSFMRRSDDEGDGLGYFAHMMLVMVLETCFMLLAAPVVYYVSRMREFRADQGSAKYTDRATMIHALESLKRCAEMVDNSHQPALATLKINGRAPGLLAKFFSSHPPLEARIAALKSLTGLETAS